MKRLAVFCGSNFGKDPAYRVACETLAEDMVSKGIDLVYGGGKVGLMGVMADSVLDRGGKAIGVIPEKLAQREVAHLGLTELIVVATMHERKAKMAELSDGFVAFPGGIGTLEEITEIFTWAQLGYHSKPCALLNINGFYDPLIRFLNTMVEDGFMKQERVEALLVISDPAKLLAAMAAQQ
jgi:uncharacterized protein (TIGR00730 family)